MNMSRWVVHIRLAMPPMMESSHEHFCSSNVSRPAASNTVWQWLHVNV